jgi:CRP/FNR family transcriptional regulator, cyclic AMP receptor protein
VLSKEDMDFLRGLSVFAGLREPVLGSIGEQARRLDLAPGQVLFEEGEPAKEMVVVLAGTLEVVKRADSGVESRIAHLGPGDVVGEMALVDIQPRSAAVRSVGQAAVVVLSAADLAGVYREDKQSYTLLVMNIAREISIRLRRLDAALANIMAEIGEATRPLHDRLVPSRAAEPAGGPIRPGSAGGHEASGGEDR